MEKNTALEAMNNAKLALDYAAAHMHAAVTVAREAGASWAAIGEVLGSSKQAAQQKYGKPAQAPKNARYDCSCGWSVVWPPHDAEGAADDIADHQQQHQDEDERAAEAEAAAAEKAPEEPSIFLDPIAPAKAKRRTEAQVLADYEAHRARKATMPEICPGCDAGRWHKTGTAFKGCVETQNDHEWTDRWPLQLAKTWHELIGMWQTK